MADVRPFRAVRYADPSPAVTAPPYDVLDEPQRAELRARDPHNAVWLTSDPDEAAAGRRFRTWLDEWPTSVRSARSGTPTRARR